MENSKLEQYRILKNNKNQRGKNALEQTDSPDFTKIQNNINGLSDPSRTELGNSSTQISQPTEDNDELQPIINNKNGVFENVNTIFTIINLRY